MTDNEIDALARECSLINGGGSTHFIEGTDLRPYVRAFARALAERGTQVPAYRAVGWIGSNGEFNKGCPGITVPPGWVTLFTEDASATQAPAQAAEPVVLTKDEQAVMRTALMRSVDFGDDSYRRATPSPAATPSGEAGEALPNPFGPGRFKAWKKDLNDLHSPWWVIAPGGEMFEVNHHADDAVDCARAMWIAAACNALAAKPRPAERAGAGVNRYCRAGMCVESDPQHEPGCTAHATPKPAEQAAQLAEEVKRLAELYATADIVFADDEGTPPTDEEMADARQRLHDAIDRLDHSRDFYQRRVELLQKWQSRMRDPERTIVCDIIANGLTLPDADGSRYGVVIDRLASLAVPGGMKGGA